MVPPEYTMIESRTISEERYQELAKAEDRDNRMCEWVYDHDEGSMPPGELLDKVIDLYEPTLWNRKNPKFSDGTQIFPNRKD